MILSNDHNLPSSLVSVLTQKNYDLTKSDPLRIGVTTLNNPPRIRQLMVRHWNEIEEDLSEQLFRLLGEATHYVLAQTNPHQKLIEEKLTEEVDGITLVAKPDLYDDELKSIEDWKVTSCWSVKSVKSDWISQCNAYAWFLVRAGFEVKKVFINAILKDWSKMEKLRFGPTYPPIPFKRIEIPLWSFDEQEKYIRDRIALYKSTLNLSDENLPICSEEERWASPEKWAIHKNKNKTAKKLCSSYEEAKEYANKIKDTKNKYNIIKREGCDTRCMSYCICNKFCSYWVSKYGGKK